MKTYHVIIALITFGFGCATHHENVSLNLNGSEKVIRQRLQDELIPFPQTTPFDSDAKKREAFLTGFCKAWDFVVSGDALHATMGVSIPNGFEESWNAGWKDGYKVASECWMREFEKLREHNARQNSSP